MKILILNGPNLNLLGARDQSNYGQLSLDQIQSLIISEFPNDTFEFVQSNTEGDLVEQIQNADGSYDGLIINPGGYAHTSIAIRDALELAKLPKIEVHLSNLSQREDFRQKMITAPKTNGYISGFKDLSYLAGIYLIKKIAESSSK
ncbi:MAG: type II 3-dehydroquinate dehydratase [Bacteroidota bacterium]